MWRTRFHPTISGSGNRNRRTKNRRTKSTNKFKDQLRSSRLDLAKKTITYQDRESPNKVAGSVLQSGNSQRRVSEWLAASLEMKYPARGCEFESRALRFLRMLQKTECDQCQRKKTKMIAVNIHASAKTSTSFFF